MEKGKRQQRRRDEDAVFNRMLIGLAAAVAAELFVFLLRQAYVDMAFGVDLALALNRVFSVFRFLGPVLIAGGIVWLAVSLRQGRSPLIPAIVAGVSAALWVISTLLYYFFDTGLQALIVIPPVAAVLILIWFLYQRVFFFTALISGCGLAALWLCREYYGAHPARIRIIFGAGLLLLGLAMLLTVKLKNGGGKLGSLRLLPEGSSYPMIYVTCALTAVTMALSLILGATAAFYLLFVLAGWLFVQAVYFTVKLM